MGKRGGSTISCGCTRYRYVDLTGKTFGKLTALRRLPCSTPSGAIWECSCVCGGTIKATSARLIAGNSGRPRAGVRSCGCLRNKGNPLKLPAGGAARNALLGRYKFGAKKRDIEWALTEEEAIALFTSDCFYCGAAPSQVMRGRFNGDYIYNGIDRADSAKGYIPDNCVPCCGSCNVAKMLLPQERFIILANAIAARHPRAVASSGFPPSRSL